jgi:hypothetical protein
MPNGNIATPVTLDTLSTFGTTVFPPLAIGGKQKTMETIKTGEDFFKIMDPTESAGTHPPVPGSNPVPPYIPTPTQIQRPSIVAVQNTSVYFEGNLVTVSGDGMDSDPPTVPTPRPLTEPTIYPTILIGTRTV